MNAQRAMVTVATVAVLSCIVSASEAQERACASGITRANLVQCALSASLTVAMERQELQAAEARRLAVSPLLPSNPVLALSLAHRTAPSAQATNWSATLSQELEIAGQRGARRGTADAAIDAQSQRVQLARRETAALAWQTFFEALAAVAAVQLAERSLTSSQALAAVARARAEQGLIAAIDADVAATIALQALQAQLAAERRSTESRASLLSMFGLDPLGASLAVAGELLPIAGVDEALAEHKAEIAADRPELRVFDAQRRSHQLQAAALRQSRIPNPTLSLFAQRDGLNERVLGLGVALPLPLPGNVGRTYAGEIAESEALARRAVSGREAAERQLRLQLALAAQAFASRTREVQAFSPAALAQAEASLVSLRVQVEAGRLPLRDAVLAEQSLIELLRANIEARRAWCLASLSLARALGMPLEGSSR